MNINWIAGFINADGGFFLSHRITKSELGQVIYSIHISQDGISKIVLDAIADFFKFGVVRKKSTTSNVYQYSIESLENINKFIQLFNEAKIFGAKSLDYRDFCIGIDLISNKKHKTMDGMNQIRLLIDNLNAKRTLFD